MLNIHIRRVYHDGKVQYRIQYYYRIPMPIVNTEHCETEEQLIALITKIVNTTIQVV